MKTQQEITVEELKLISKIAKRFVDQTRFSDAPSGSPSKKVPFDFMGLTMDIERTHEINPLDLQGLFLAKQSDFFHDIGGIYRNFNRETLQLDNCFLPRYSI